MTRNSTKQRGVTLVEVVLTLGISTLLIATVLSGRNSLRSQAQFSDGMERIKETILSVKTEANTGNNEIGNGTSRIDGVNDRAYALLGRSLFFDTAASTTMRPANVLCYGPVPAPNQPLACAANLTSSFSSRKNLPIPWSIQYKGYTTATASTPVSGKLSIVFARDEQAGSFTGSWYPNEIVLGTPRATVFARQDEITLHFESTDGRKATVEINPITGTVTRNVL